MTTFEAEIPVCKMRLESVMSFFPQNVSKVSTVVLTGRECSEMCTYSQNIFLVGSKATAKLPTSLSLDGATSL